MSKPVEVDQNLIRAIAELLNEQNLAEIEIERDDFRVRITRAHANPGAINYSAPPPTPGFGAEPASAVSGIPVAGVAPAAEDLAALPGTLTSPMVGTAYLAPEPGAKDFVEIGTQVSEGQTVLIIEAMKTMNQIPAHRSGKITRILIENAQPVEYGEALVIIE